MIWKCKYLRLRSRPMKRSFKSTSVIILLVMAGFFVFPLFAHIDCESSCCGITSDFCTMDSGPCCVEITECDGVDIVPVVSAPLSRVSVQVEISIGSLLSNEITFSTDDEIQNTLNHYKFLHNQIQPDHYTPLLI